MVFEKQLTMRGFLVGQLASAYGAEHQKNVQKWLHDGTFKAAQHTTYGIDNAAEGFIGMLKGDNFGKAVLQIADLTKEVRPTIPHMLFSAFALTSTVRRDALPSN